MISSIRASFVKTTRVHISTFFLALASFIGAATVGGRLHYGLVFVAVSLLISLVPILTVSVRLTKEERYAVLFLSGFVVLVFSSLVYAVDLQNAPYYAVWVFLAFVGFYISLLLRRYSDSLNFFVRSFYALMTVLSLVGIYLYSIDSSSYVRMDSLVFNHNVFGAFLLFPILFSLYEISRESKKITLTDCTAPLVWASFILTLSRGNYIALVVGIIFLVLFSSQILGQLRTNWFKLVSILVVTVVLSAGIYQLRVIHLERLSGTQPVIFNNETADANGATSRFAYMKTGITMFQKNTLLGVGWAGYADAEPMYRDNPTFSSQDPHNLFIRILAELGVVGFIFFVIAFGYPLLLVLFSEWKKRNNTHAMQGVLIAALVALAFHSMIDVDWFFPAMILLFLSCLGYVFPSKETKHETISSGSKTNKALAFFAFLTIVAAFFAVADFKSTLAMQGGEELKAFGKTSDALQSFDKAIQWNPLNADAYIERSKIQYLLAKSNNTFGKNFSGISKDIEQALILRRNKPEYWYGFGLLYQEIGATSGAQYAFKQSIMVNPTSETGAALALANLYYNQKQYDRVIAILDHFRIYFTPAVFTNPFWGDPEKPEIKQELEELYVGGMRAADNLGNKSKVAQYTKELQSYQSNQ